MGAFEFGGVYRGGVQDKPAGMSRHFRRVRASDVERDLVGSGWERRP